MRLASAALCRHVLCQFYDELARREWSESAARGDSNFDINVVCRSIDRDILEAARADYDHAYGPRAKQDGYEVTAPSASSGGRGGKGGQSRGKQKYVAKNFVKGNHNGGKRQWGNQSQSNWGHDKKHKSWY